jgi:hypothetical protein
MVRHTAASDLRRTVDLTENAKRKLHFENEEFIL